MKKIKFLGTGLLLLSIISFNGCGGGGGSSSNSTTQYDMWDYFAPQESKTYMLDSYKSNSSYTVTTDREIDSGYIGYTVLSYTEKTVDFNGEMIATLTLNGNSIRIEDISITRYKSIGDKLGKCTLSKHYDTLTIANTYTFSDVLELDCSKYREFYVKNKGNLINYMQNTFVEENKKRYNYYISVANN